MGNSYSLAAQEASELFAEYLNGNANKPLLVVSRTTLPEDTVDALARSMEFFGYGNDACSFVILEPQDVPALDAQAAFMLVESLDPLFVVATDNAAIHMLSRAYRCEFNMDAAIRVFGRQAVAFSNLPALLDTPQGKQRAWSLLKSLNN